MTSRIAPAISDANNRSIWLTLLPSASDLQFSDLQFDEASETPAQGGLRRPHLDRGNAPSTWGPPTVRVASVGAGRWAGQGKGPITRAIALVSSSRPGAAF